LPNTHTTSDALAQAFRACAGEFPTGVAVVTAEHGGVPTGMTLNAFASVSLDPLLVLISLGHGSRTLWATTESGRFGVSVLRRDQAQIALDFSERGAPFRPEHVDREPDGYSTVRGAVAVLRCAVWQILPAGDHDVVFGNVESIAHPGGEPLVFYRGRFGGMQTDALVPAGHPIAIDEGAGW